MKYSVVMAASMLVVVWAMGSASEANEAKNGWNFVAWDCNDAVDDYNTAMNEVASYLDRYARCVRNSAGDDDCSSEFRRLRNAQSEFESAVSEYQSYCR